MENIIRVKNGESILEAQLKARELKNATVIVEEGVYRESLELDERDSGTFYIGENAVLTGGLEVAYSDTKAVSEEIKARLSPEAAENVRCIDLSAYGFTKDDWGDLCAIGSYHTAHKYTNGKVGVNMEVFSGGSRMTVARYPNEGFLKIDNVLDVGDCWEFPSRNYFLDWRNRKDHRGGCYLVDVDTVERMKNWKDPETAWIFGYFMHDWADASTPIARMKLENRLIYPEYVAHYGCRKGAEYYFYNVLEELDIPGEYFLDRNSGMLYVYPYSKGDCIEISLLGTPIIRNNGADNVTIDGFTVKCCKSNGIVIKADGCTVKNCVVKNVAENGIVMSGYNNIVDNCEVTRTGKGGIIVSGGDRQTLTPGNNKVTNNYIHHFSEVYQTYQAGVSLSGVGNLCAHNEICFTPHMAIGYGGNDIVIEYNYIHDAVLYSGDAGAIYAGKDWTFQGCVIRYNIIKDIGSETLAPVGIYWDDGLSGQTAYGNIVINARDNACGVGGGRDNKVCNNVLIDCGRTSISYDDRNRDGFVNGGSFKDAVINEDSILWERLRAVPYKSDVWAEKYPTLAKVVTDFEKFNDPDFPINTTYVEIKNNIVIREKEDKFDIADSVYEYGTVENNIQFRSYSEATFDMDTLKFSVLPEGFEEIPVDKIGRNKGE